MEATTKTYIEVNDGQVRWLADAQELQDALTLLGWSNQGSLWFEPETEQRDGFDEPYTVLCGHCSDLSDEIPSELRDDMATFTWCDDLRAWRWRV